VCARGRRGRGSATDRADCVVLCERLSTGCEVALDQRLFDRKEHEECHHQDKRCNAQQQQECAGVGEGRTVKYVSQLCVCVKGMYALECSQRNILFEALRVEGDVATQESNTPIIYHLQLLLQCNF
jgi:hypothetical protein